MRKVFDVEERRRTMESLGEDPGQRTTISGSAAHFAEYCGRFKLDRIEKRTLQEGLSDLRAAQVLRGERSDLQIPDYSDLIQEVQAEYDKVI